MKSRKGAVTQTLQALVTGDKRAGERLFPLVYDEFRALAGSFFRRESAGHTLQPTALVHEVYLRLVDQKEADWKGGRAQFFAVGAMVMRRILVDHARAKRTEKRGGGVPLVALSEELGLPEVVAVEDVLDVDRALEKLAALDPRQAKIVELRVFAGMSVEEVALAIGVSPRTVDNEWKMVRAWLRRELKRQRSDP